MNIIILIITLLFLTLSVQAKTVIEPGANQTELYMPLLEGKTVGVFSNHTSMIKKTHLVDALLKHHIRVVKIFAPEHGFRGEEDAHIKNSFDEKTGLPIVSLYGNKLKPSAEDLKGIDVLIFDIQDVGVRFYTYIASLQKLMEAAAENHKPLIVLDRPNPNGFYVDGPVLDPQYKSFTGMQPVPIVYGMTIGEYAKMLVGEQWLTLTPKSKAKELQLTVIPCKNYDHNSLYVPPIKPSPNLWSIQSIYWYPSIGFMEPTAMSVGRGTRTPFQVYGHPSLQTEFKFKPKYVIGGAAPRYRNQICYGWDLRGKPDAVLKNIDRKLQIKYLLRAYEAYPDKQHFFQGFRYAAGSRVLEQQIKQGLSETEIRKSWEQSLNNFKQIRKKYLLYPDFD